MLTALALLVGGARAEAAVEVVDADGGLVHLDGPGARPAQRFELVLGRAGIASPLLALTTGPSDDGERAVFLRVDGSGIVQWQTARSVARCDAESRLYVRKWDFSAGGFVAADPPLPDGRELVADLVRPSSSPWPTAAAPFRFDGSSASVDAEERADRLAAPVELEDGDRHTAWRPGQRRAWVVAHASTATPVTAVEIDGLTRPLTLALEVDGAIFRAALVTRRAHFSLPALPPAHCVALLFDGMSPGWAVGEIRIETVPEDPKAVVERVRTGALGSVQDAAQIEALGLAALSELAHALPRATSDGSARALVELLGKLPSPATPALVAALSNPHVPAEEAAAKALATRSDALEPLVALLEDPVALPSVRARAAQLLGRLGARDALVQVAGQGTPALRAAIRDALAANPEGRSEAARALTMAVGDDWSRLADLARVAAANDPAAVTPAIERLFARPDASWEAKLALVALAGRAADQAVIRSALADAEPVLRRAAIVALAGLPTATRTPLVAHAAVDPDPGVRHDALLALDEESPAADALRISALDDRWPLVRAAAATALSRHCTPTGTSALWSELTRWRDPPALRIELVAAADHCGVSLDHLAQLVADPDASPRVRSEAARRGAARVPADPAARHRWLRALETGIEELMADDLRRVDDPTGDDAGEANAVALALCTTALGASAVGAGASADRADAAQILTRLSQLRLPNVRRAAERALAQCCACCSGAPQSR